MATKKTKSKTKIAPTEKTLGLAVYRCRYCGQLFCTSNKPAPHSAWLMYAWHVGTCLTEADGYGDLVAVVYPGHPGYPPEGGEA